MRKTDRFFQSALLFILMVFLIWSCGSNPSPIQPEATAPISTNCRIIDHAKGQTEICGQLQRVAALSPYILDMILALGVEPAAYAAADVQPELLRKSKFENPSEQIPYLGDDVTTQPINLGDRHSPSLETLTQVQPDLILGEVWQGSQGKYELFSQIAPTVLVDDQQGGWQRSIQTLAQALNKESELEQTKATYESEIAQARTQLSSVVAKYPRVLIISSGNLSGEIYTYHCSEFSRLLEALGFQLASLNDPANCDATFSLEVLPQTEADLIFVVAWDTGNQGNAEGWRKRQQEWNQIPLLQKMPASQAGRVYFIDARLSTMRGPLAADAILDLYLDRLAPLMAERLH